MDVCDAVMSRRDMETRQRILKDSHCGAFAVICMVLLALGQWSAFLSMADVPLWPLALILGVGMALYGVCILWTMVRRFVRPETEDIAAPADGEEKEGDA